MKKTAFVLAGLIGLSVTACGSDSGGGGTAFADQLSDACQNLDTKLGDLKVPADLKGMRTFAVDASDLYSSTVTAVKKLKPTAEAKSAFEDLRDNMESQLDLLDDIAKAAKNDKQDDVDAAVTKFNSLADDNADLARKAGARRCAIDSPLAGGSAPTDDTTATSTDDTTADTTETSTADSTADTTADTKPTLPPVTGSTAKPTVPVGTDVLGAGDKVLEDLPSQMGPSSEGYTFGQVEQQYIDNFLKFLTRTEAMNSASGFYGAVEILKDTQPFARVFALVTDPALPDGAIGELVDSLASGQPITPTTIANIDGLHFTSTDSYEFFVAGNETDGMFMFVTADPQSMDVAVQAFFESVQG